MTKKILTEQQFFAEHRIDYRGLSKAEKDRRYRSYVASMEGQREHTKLVGSSASSGRRRGKHLAIRRAAVLEGDLHDPSRDIEELLEAGRSPFLAAMLDPWSVGPQRLPMFGGLKTGVYSVTFRVPIGTTKAAGVGNGGDAAFFIRPAIDDCYAVSTVNSGGSPSFVQTEQMYYKLLNQSGAPVNAAPFTADGWCVGRAHQGSIEMGTWARHGGGLQSIPKAATLRNLFAAYRCTAMGVKFMFTQDIDNTEGKVVVAPWKGTSNVPTDTSYFLDMGNTAVEQFTVASHDFIGPNYQSVSVLQEAETFRAMEGFSTVWRPSSEEAFDLRPMHYQPISNGASVAQNNFVQIQNQVTGTNAEAWFPPSCNCDPQEFRANMDRFYSQNEWPNGASTTNPAATGLRGTPASATPATQAQYTSQQMISQMLDWQNTQMSDADNGIMVIFEGCAENVVLGEFEVTMHFEGVVDQQSLDFSGAPVVSQHRDVSKILHLAHGPRAAISETHRVVSGSFDTGGDAWHQNIANGVTSAINSVAAVANTAQAANAAVASATGVDILGEVLAAAAAAFL